MVVFFKGHLSGRWISRLPYGRKRAASFFHYQCRRRTKRVGIVLLVVWCLRQLDAFKANLLRVSPGASAFRLRLATFYPVPVFVLFRTSRKSGANITNGARHQILLKLFSVKIYVETPTYYLRKQGDSNNHC